MASSVIVALDLESRRETLQVVRALGPQADFYKIGLQLLTLEGPGFVRELVAMGKQVFLDLKLHEIPNSVAGAVKAAGRSGAAMVSVHASGGATVMRAAVDAARGFDRLQVLALTVITSLGDADLQSIGLAPSVRDQVCRLAQLAAASGCDGVIASAQEAAYLADLLPNGSLIVTPGIQLAGAPGSDQSRVATPDFARRSGATHIVVGRAITHAADPAQAYAVVKTAFGL